MAEELGDSVKQLADYIKGIANGSRKYLRATFELLCDPVDHNVAIHGLTGREFNAFASALARTNLGKTSLPSTSIQRVFRLLIPAQRPPVNAVDKILVWFMSCWKKLPRNAAKTIFMWFIGALKFELIQPDDINWCYDVFFQDFGVKTIGLQQCKFLEFLTTPDMITKYRTKQLLGHFQSQNMKGPIVHLLSLYKTLRPDKVPMEIPVIVSGFVGSTGEKDMTQLLSLAAARFDTNTSSSFKAIRWALQKNSTGKKNCILPQVTYHATAAKDKRKELLDCATIEDVALNILLAKTPAQILALATSPEALFYLRFQGNQEVNYRFTYVLHRMFLDIDSLYYDPKYKSDIIDLLKFLKVKQDIDQSGSFLVTKFVRHFLHFIQNPVFLPYILELFGCAHFSSTEDVSTNLLVYLERMFYVVTFEDKELIIESIWTLVDHLLLQMVEGNADNLNWEPEETLKTLLGLIEKMYNYCISTKGLAHLGHMKYSAMIHYIELSEKEEQLYGSLNLFTFAPSGLLISCFTSGPVWLLEKTSELIMMYKDRFNLISAAERSKLKSMAKNLEEVFNCGYEILFQHGLQPPVLLRRVLVQGLIPVISRTAMSKPALIRHFGTLPERLTAEKIGSEWSLQDLLEFCENNYPSYTKLIEFYQIENN